MGKIYMIESPNKSKYIGQTTYDVMDRWRDHLYDAFDKKKDKCKALNNSIRKHDGKGFTITTLIEINDKYLDYYEAEFIQMYKTYVPYGLNIKLGGSSGKHNEETKEKIRASLKGKEVSKDRRLKLSNTKNPDLPMYVIKVYQNDEHIGYRVCNHPNGQEKRFANKQETLHSKLQKALNHLEYLDSIDSNNIPVSNTSNLPKYLQKYADGYCVKYPNAKIRYFVSKKKSNTEKLEMAMEYLNILTINDEAQRLDGSGSSKS